MVHAIKSNTRTQHLDGILNSPLPGDGWPSDLDEAPVEIGIHDAITYFQNTRNPDVLAQIAGVQFPNDDGSDRWHVANALTVGEVLALRAEPSNQFDENAIAIHNQSGFQVGYIPAFLSSPVAALLRNGEEFACIVYEVRRGSIIPAFIRLRCITTKTRGHENTRARTRQTEC